MTDDIWEEPEPTPEEKMAATLQNHPDYRVLRRFQPVESYRPGGEGLKVGLFVDCETTGLDVTRDKIIEAGVLPFTFDPAGVVYDVLPGYSGLEDPGAPLPPEIVSLTGITDGDLLGQKMDDDEVLTLANMAAIVIAKRAEFDRPLFERRWPFFAEMPWGCLEQEVPWVSYGFRDRRLTSLLQDVCGMFHEGHRALDDCRLGVHLLSCVAPVREQDEHGAQILGVLLESARKPTHRLLAWRSSFDSKDAMKRRGYRALYRNEKFATWYRDCTPEQIDAEREWAIANTGAAVETVKFNAYSRYSLRV